MTVYQVDDAPIPDPDPEPEPTDDYTALGCAADFEDPNRVRYSRGGRWDKRRRMTALRST